MGALPHAQRHARKTRLRQDGGHRHGFWQRWPDDAPGQDFPKADGEHDTTRFEVTLLRETLGKFLPFVLPLVGLKQLETRADLDAVAARLMSLGL